MITRREFLKFCAAAGTASLLSTRFGFIRRVSASPVEGGTLDPTTITKYAAPLVIPPAMPRTSKLFGARGKTIDYYEIAVRQFEQQILPPGMPPTTVWSYGSVNHPGTFNYPAFSIEAKYNKPVRVKWINDLVDANGNYLHHLLPVDQTLHWANPPGGDMGRDMRGMDPTPYDGPVPIVTHVHGSHADQESDGFAEAWYLPAAIDIPAGYATTGTYYDIFNASSPNGNAWTPGSAVFEYPNDQRASTLWYHDHTLGMTRLNVYAGPAGFYILRGGPDDAVVGTLPGPAPALGDPPGMAYYEIPIGIQDRSFNDDGSLWFPPSRADFDDFEGPYIPDSDISPIWNPEFFGNTMVVNGKTWPVLDVEPRRYRFRFLNGCNSRFLILQFDDPNLTFWQIGTEGGFLPAPVQLPRLLLGLAERADVIVDFTGYAPGTEILLLNLGPDEPFGGGEPDDDFEPADPQTTGQVMKFRVVPRTSRDTSTPPAQLVLPAFTPLGAATNTRQVSLNELDSDVLEDVGPREAVLGEVDLTDPSDPHGIPREWADPITQLPLLGSTEVWEMYNFTVDAHPIHIHLVQFQVVDRQPIDGGPARPPEPWEVGFKDTVSAYPGEITRVKATFDKPGLFVWHCHIVDHEDNEMMRPYRVV